jgi:hypothetical protein
VVGDVEVSDALKFGDDLVVELELGGLVAGPGIVGSGVGHQDGLEFERVRLDSPDVCPGGDVVQVILEDPAGHHRVLLACPYGGVVREQSGLNPGVISNGKISTVHNVKKKIWSSGF